MRPVPVGVDLEEPQQEGRGAELREELTHTRAHDRPTKAANEANPI